MLKMTKFFICLITLVLLANMVVSVHAGIVSSKEKKRSPIFNKPITAKSSVCIDKNIIITLTPCKDSIRILFAKETGNQESKIIFVNNCKFKQNIDYNAIQGLSPKVNDFLMSRLTKNQFKWAKYYFLTDPKLQKLIQ